MSVEREPLDARLYVTAPNQDSSSQGSFVFALDADRAIKQARMSPPQMRIGGVVLV